MSRKKWAKHLSKNQRLYRQILSQLPLLFRVLAFLIRIPIFERTLIWINENSIPGELGHIYLRKIKIAEWITNSSAKHLIIFGSGFDVSTLTQNAKNFDTIIEVDSERIIGIKKRIVAAHGISNVEFTSSLLDQKIWESIPKNENVLVICEGFWEYLSKNDLKELLLGIITHFTNIELIGTLYDFVRMPSKVKKSYTFWTSLFGEHLNETHSKNYIPSLLEQVGFILRENINVVAANEIFETERIPLTNWEQFELGRWEKSEN